MDTPKSHFVAKDTFAKLLGIEITHVEPGAAEAQMTITSDHHNGHGTVHGAVMFALADVAFSAACNEASSAIGVQTDMRFFAKPDGNQLFARAEEVSASRKLAHYQVQIFDQTKQHVAQFTGMVYRF